MKRKKDQVSLRRWGGRSTTGYTNPGGSQSMVTYTVASGQHTQFISNSNYANDVMASKYDILLKVINKQMTWLATIT